ncbi:hypothetical protein YW5DRAFT_03395 [Streptomyces sp. Ncost-T6T-1]|uniref:hypothetical protein n=1 Tax=unclassified Streptomyces TaxID=2593676 RepID=UPI00080578F2|nr:MULTISPECIES: hypothetical protein [unclassified Streptomyces]MYV60056.1 hypothetical protein [Streptomyces sp. SID4931]PVC91160.1 hypothetical protein DBP20_01650 [Streptomyces sp. CS131]SBV06185.1 hypothetical protein YW5DRAFT_03395 [Streptomyces sp. Ncost-T6T-1]
MFPIPAKKHLLAGLALAAAVSGLLTAPATAREAQALGQCTVSASNPMHTGNYVWAEAPWNCSLLPPDGGAKTYVNLYRDGTLVKTAEFWQNGAFNNVYSTGVPCIGGTHTYQVRTHGWDSDHISYDAWSQEISLGC